MRLLILRVAVVCDDQSPGRIAEPCTRLGSRTSALITPASRQSTTFGNKIVPQILSRHQTIPRFLKKQNVLTQNCIHFLVTFKRRRVEVVGLWNV